LQILIKPGKSLVAQLYVPHLCEPKLIVGIWDAHFDFSISESQITRISTHLFEVSFPSKDQLESALKQQEGLKIKAQPVSSLQFSPIAPF
jgi:hypothetical protein